MFVAISFLQLGSWEKKKIAELGKKYTFFGLGMGPNFDPTGKSENPLMAATFFNGSKFREQFLKRVTQGKIPVKLFQNLTSCFREEISLKSTQ